MIGGETGFLPSLGWAVVNSLWQMAFLWVIYQLITEAYRSVKPGTKSVLASLFLITGFTWFVFTFFSIYNTGSVNYTFISAALTGTVLNGEINNWIKDALPVASVVYLFLLLFPVLHFIRNYRYVHIIRHYGLTKINVDWRIFVKNIAARMGIKKPVRIWVSEFVTSPVTVGFLKPIILVPIAAINHLSTPQLEAILLHELSHIKRFDYFINLIVNFIQTILYFNPFVKAFVKIVEREREKSCDEMVLQFQYDSHEYASALLTLEKTNYKQGILALASGGKKNDLLNRVETIMGVEKKPVFSLYKLAGVLAGLFCIIALNTLLTANKSVYIIKADPSYSYLSSPFTAMANGYYDKPVNKLPSAIVNSEVAVNKEEENNFTRDVAENISEVNTEHPANIETEEPIYTDPDTPFRQAGFETVLRPELQKQQEEQVKAAMEASRKILENAQWKAFEKNIADVFTEKEKEELKASYRNEVNKFDWDKWENKLRLAFEKVDWDNVNYQLTNAVNQIRIDSLQKVYSNVVVKLNDVQKELSLKGLTGIPDSDITLNELEQKKQEALKNLLNLKVIRNKKVVHL